MSLAPERSFFQDANDHLKEKEALAEKQREEDKKREEGRKQEEDTRKKTEETKEFTIKRLTKDMKEKDKEIERLRAAEQDKNQNLIKMQNNQEAKEKERKQAANKANKLEAKCKEMEGKLEAELKAKECAHGESGEGVNNHSLGGKYLLTCELVLICVGA